MHKSIILWLDLDFILFYTFCINQSSLNEKFKNHICLFLNRYLLDTLNFLDETRVGVWGWGYGGYVTAMLLGTQQNVFKCGIAVSPITDWLYYSKTLNYGDPFIIRLDMNSLKL